MDLPSGGTTPKEPLGVACLGPLDAESWLHYGHREGLDPRSNPGRQACGASLEIRERLMQPSAWLA